MNSSMDRLVELFSILGLDTSEGTITRAEICGYCAGLEAASRDIASIEESIFSPDRKEYMPKMDYTQINYSSQLQQIGGICGYVDNMVRIIRANPLKLGEFWNQWGYPFVLVQQGGVGTSWKKIDDSMSCWHKNDDMLLLWSMIDTMEV